MNINDVNWADATLRGFSLNRANLEIAVDLWDERQAMVIAEDCISTVFAAYDGSIDTVAEGPLSDRELAHLVAIEELPASFRALSIKDQDSRTILHVVARGFQVDLRKSVA